MPKPPSLQCQYAHQPALEDLYGRRSTVSALNFVAATCASFQACAVRARAPAPTGGVARLTTLPSDCASLQVFRLSSFAAELCKPYVSQGGRILAKPAVI